MTRKQAIMDYLKNQESSTSRELCDCLGISRQALNLHLRELIDAGKVIRTGATRSTKYYLSGYGPKKTVFKKTALLSGLDESRVYEQVATMLNFRSVLPANQESIMNYGFTEMLNNAIDHSKAEKCDIRVSLDAAKAGFEIRDRGIGVFHSIASKFNLEDEYAGTIELLKGKTTTQPEAHSGEGIFFTSRAADRFILDSHKIRLEWDNSRDDVFVSQPRHLKGTRVRFEIGRTSRTTLETVFSQFAPAEYDFEFSKTRIMVQLLKREFISRSEAKRLLLNLEKFREIELNFKNVSQVGQGFADEVFRVFAGRYPHVILKATDTNSATQAMIEHVAHSPPRA